MPCGDARFVLDETAEVVVVVIVSVVEFSQNASEENTNALLNNGCAS
jgi:hypothetical protein